MDLTVNDLYLFDPHCIAMPLMVVKIGCDVESLWPVMQAIETTKSKCWRVLVGMKSLEFYNVCTTSHLHGHRKNNFCHCCLQDNQKLDRPRDMKLEHADSIRIVAPAELRKKVLLRYAPVMKKTELFCG